MSDYHAQVTARMLASLMATEVHAQLMARSVKALAESIRNTATSLRKLRPEDRTKTEETRGETKADAER